LAGTAEARKQAFGVRFGCQHVFADNGGFSSTSDGRVGRFSSFVPLSLLLVFAFSFHNRFYPP